MLVQRFDRHAESEPDKIAVVSGDTQLTYGRLRRLSTLVAARLTRLGIGRGGVVGICLPRTPDVIACMLGVLRAGAAYAVLEHEGDEPIEVVRTKLSKTDLVITDLDQSELPVRTVLFADMIQSAESGVADDRPPSPEDPAYVLYTSGSTGPPKGVVVTHGNVRHYVESLLERLRITAPLSYAHVSTLSADLGNTCLFLPLWTGGVVHLVGYQERSDAQLLMNYLSSRSIDVLKITPSHWGAMLRAVQTAERRPRLAYLLLGGESLPVGLARETLRYGVTPVLVNHYGPTEATIGVSTKVLHHERDLAPIAQAGDGSVPIGVPLGSTRLVVRTDDGTWADSGATGELYIGGPSVAAGYIGDAAANERAFVTDERSGERFYRTGDLVRLDDDGEATFLGRTDRLVKISGYRVGLEYVESVIREQDDVEDAACQLLTVGERQALVAGVVTGSAATVETLAARLRQRLAAPMVPSRFFRVPDLPRNGNGKLDARAVRRLLGDQLATPGNTREDAGTEADGLTSVVADLFRRYLGRDDFGADDDFFELGGNSLDAIQVIAELQRAGHTVTTSSFLAAPTARLLAGLLAEPSPAPSPRPHPSLAEQSTRSTHTEFSEAQRWFFAQEFVQPDHWNQAILFEVVGPDSVDPQILRRSLEDLVRLHPLLRTRFRVEDGRWVAEALDAPPASTFSKSTLDSADERHAGDHIQRVARRLHAEINLESGAVFRTHLFKGPDRDHLLMVCHHLSVDAVSWRIMIANLSSLYGAHAHGLPADIRGETTGFWEWVRAAGQGRGAADPPDISVPGNDEASAGTAWLMLSEDETAQLIRRLPTTSDARLHEALLGAFAYAVTSRRGLDGVLVDVEAHGRDGACGAHLDISRTIGWFTRTHRLELDRAANPPAAIRQASGALRRAADRDPCDRALRPAERHPRMPLLSYNYLGRFDFPQDGALRLRPAEHPIGPARGDANDRVHDLKLTARVVGGRLAIDLSFCAGHADAADITAVLDDMRAMLLRFVDPPADDGSAAWVTTGSTTGLLTHVPVGAAAVARPVAQPTRQARRDNRNVLVTGATGFLGVHLLREFLAKTDAHLYCLVRAADDQSARRRLTDAYEWYFADDAAPSIHPGQISVVAGDASEPGLGLPGETYRRLCADVDAIYHLAADTRLFCHRDVTRRANVDSVREMIRLASTARRKDLHYMSTLAVCGYNTSAKPIPFTEDSLDIGQRFLNEYEESKFQAELLIQKFVAAGGAGFVYRAGNVTGHSRTARFQRNAGQNRFVQLLRALVKLGRIPALFSEEIPLSPVDVVAAAVFALSTSPSVSAGTFHVDSDHTMGYERIFDGLCQLGFRFQPTAHSAVHDLLEDYADIGDPELALAYFWASRESRNVTYRNHASQRLLARLGVRFEPMDEAWIRRFLTHLVDQDIFDRPRSEEPTFRA